MRLPSPWRLRIPCGSNELAMDESDLMVISREDVRHTGIPLARSETTLRGRQKHWQVFVDIRLDAADDNVVTAVQPK